MQYYPPQTQMWQQPPLQPAIPMARPQAHAHRSSRTYPAPSIKYTAAESTRAVRGDSESSDDDDETVAAFTTTSIASSHSRAPGNKPKQQRRVMNWVDDTSHYTSKFKSPFVPPSGATSKASSSSHGHRKSGHHSRHESIDHDDRGRKREPPPIWVPRHTSHSEEPVRRVASQPVLFRQQQPPMQYSPPQPVRYAQPPMMWLAPAPAPPPGPMRGDGYVPIVPSRTVSVPHVQHNRSKVDAPIRGILKRSH